MLNITFSDLENQVEDQICKNLGWDTLLHLSSLMAESIQSLQHRLLTNEHGPDDVAEKRVAMQIIYLNLAIKQIGLDAPHIESEIGKVYQDFTKQYLTSITKVPPQQEDQQDAPEVVEERTPEVVEFPETKDFPNRDGFMEAMVGFLLKDVVKDTEGQPFKGLAGVADKVSDMGNRIGKTIAGLGESIPQPSPTTQPTPIITAEDKAEEANIIRENCQKISSAIMSFPNAFRIELCENAEGKWTIYAMDDSVKESGKTLMADYIKRKKLESASLVVAMDGVPYQDILDLTRYILGFGNPQYSIIDNEFDIVVTSNVSSPESFLIFRSIFDSQYQNRIAPFIWKLEHGDSRSAYIHISTTFPTNLILMEQLTSTKENWLSRFKAESLYPIVRDICENKMNVQE